MGFFEELRIFPFFYFKQYTPAKCVSGYSRQKKNFLDNKINNLKKSKKGIFLKGPVHSFVQKLAIFFLAIYDIVEGKNAFRGYKTKKFKKSKNWHFCKGVNPWFWSKNGYFCHFFFRQYRPGKCLLSYSRTKKHLSRL